MSSVLVHRVLATLLAASFLQLGVEAQTRSESLSTRSGVYTAEQAAQGKAVYQNKCQMCHGDSLQGMGANSPLSGAVFLNKWNGLTVADLFQKTIVMMPAMSPGTLSPKETAQIMAYILSANKFPAGKTELPSNPQSLEKIHITTPE